MKTLIWSLVILFSLSIFGVRIYKGIIFKQNVTGFLKRAADANTIDLAKGELEKVITYAKANGLTSGYTSILYQTPDEDISFWYTNIKASLNELQNLHSESALERTNVLIKLRESLIDDGEKSRVTVPKGLAIYPNNRLWALLMTIALSAMFLGSIMLAIKLEKKK